MTELHYACMDTSKAWIARACVAFNFDDINTSTDGGLTPLHYACRYGDVEVAKLLLFSGVESSLYHYSRWGEIPIDCALRYGKIDTVKLLLSYHEKDKEKALVNLGGIFVKAAQRQNLEIVKLIVSIICM